MSDEILKNIILKIRTTEERDSLYQGLEALEEVQYRLDSDEEKKIIQTKIPSVVAADLQEVLHDSFYEKIPARKNEFLQKLKDRLNSLRILKIDLSFEPKVETIQRISRFLKENVGDDVILDIGFDRTIVGGARIIFGGRYFEETLDKILAREFEQNRNIIVEMALLNKNRK